MSRSASVIIVDDEAPARRKLEHLLSRETDFRVVGEAASGPEALQVIEEMEPDLVFLDIQMPGLDGLEVARQLPKQHPPQVVFVTAYDEHALEAFEVCAFDYLLKPFSATRLRQTLDRIRKQGSRERRDLDDDLRRLLTQLDRSRGGERFLVKSRGKMLFIKSEDIDWIEAAANYAELHVGETCYLMRETLNRIEERLDPRQFARIHRSRIVNLDRIREVQPWEHGDFLVILRGGTGLRMSRRYRSNLDS